MKLCCALLLAALTVCVVLPATARADAASDARAQIQRAYNLRDAALARFDIEGYLAWDNGNYLDMSRGAHPGKTDQKRQNVIRQWQRFEKLSRQDTVQSVTMYGPDATVVVQSVLHGYGRVPKTGRKFQYVSRFINRAYWVHSKMGWRMKQERFLSDAPAAVTASAN